MPKTRRERAYEALLRYADREEAVAFRALRSWLMNLSTPSLVKLEGLIRAGDVQGALIAVMDVAGVGVEDMVTLFQSMAVKAANTYAVGGLVSELGAVKVRFDAFDPRTAAWLRQYKLDLITNINNDTREGIRTVLMRGLQEGQNPVATARRVRELIGLTPQQATAVMNYRAELETPDRGALERKLRDRRFDRTLARAIEDDDVLPQERIDRMVGRYRERYLTHRAENIARTETMRALAGGKRTALDQARDAGLFQELVMRRFWYVARDERVCQWCAPIPSMNKEGRGLDEAFDTPLGPVLDPPLHMRCRCTTFPEVVSVVVP